MESHTGLRANSIVGCRRPAVSGGSPCVGGSPAPSLPWEQQCGARPGALSANRELPVRVGLGRARAEGAGVRVLFVLRLLFTLGVQTGDRWGLGGCRHQLCLASQLCRLSDRRTVASFSEPLCPPVKWVCFLPGLR